MFSQLASGEAKELPVVIKSDVHGSMEAIVAGLQRLGTDEVSVRVLHAGVGAITESDITLALASKAWVLGFNVRANAQARELAKRDGVEIRYHSIIYELLDEAKAALSGMLTPTARETTLGHAEIREVFSITKVGKIAGCRVVDGLIRRGAQGAPAARRHRDPRRRARLAEALQGRRPRGPRGLRVRHRDRGLQRSARGRRDRGVRD